MTPPPAAPPPQTNRQEPTRPRVGLFVTCLVDAMRPRIGFASVAALEAAGFAVEVPDVQTCCGQPAYNSGARDIAADLARRVVAAFEPFDHVVAPSGSCAGMIRHHYAELLAEDPEWSARHAALAPRCFEITAFLDEVAGWRPEGLRYEGVATYHDSCSGLRELGVRDQPRRLLAAVEGLTLVPLESAERCCGFGGTFCVKYPEIATAIVDDKLRCVARSGADTLLAGDLGCLMNMAGRAARRGEPVRVFHTIELLAGMADGPGIAREGDDPAGGAR